jgi:hypothetical protein
MATALIVHTTPEPRVVVTAAIGMASPAFAALRSGKQRSWLHAAVLDRRDCANGGYAIYC